MKSVSKATLFLVLLQLCLILMLNVSCEATTALDRTGTSLVTKQRRHTTSLTVTKSNLATENNVIDVRNNQNAKRNTSVVAMEEKGPIVYRSRGGATIAVSNTNVWISALLHRLKIGFYFALWYALNVAYNSTLPFYFHNFALFTPLPTLMNHAKSCNPMFLFLKLLYLFFGYIFFQYFLSSFVF